MFNVQAEALNNKINMQRRKKEKKRKDGKLCNWWLFIHPFINKIIELLIKQYCHFTMYCCPRIVKENSLMRISFFCFMFTSVTSELTAPPLNLPILCWSWRCSWQMCPFTIALECWHKEAAAYWMCSSRRRIQKLSICKLEARILLFWREDPNLTFDGPFFLIF